MCGVGSGAVARSETESGRAEDRARGRVREQRHLLPPTKRRMGKVGVRGRGGWGPIVCGDAEAVQIRDGVVEEGGQALMRDAAPTSAHPCAAERGCGGGAARGTASGRLPRMAGVCVRGRSWVMELKPAALRAACVDGS